MNHIGRTTPPPWEKWLETLEPIPFAEPDAFDEQFQRCNVEAVRRQMNGAAP